MIIDTKELRRLAEAATPGPWKIGNLQSWHGHNGEPFRNIWRADGSVVEFPLAEAKGEYCDLDANFIAAANPFVVLKLLDELKLWEESWKRVCLDRNALREEREKLLPVLEEARKALESEKEEIVSGRLKLGMWTPLNVLREKVQACADIVTGVKDANS